MTARCQRCGHLNDALGSKKYCDICRAPLPPETPANALPASQAADAVEGQTARAARDPRARYRAYKPAPPVRPSAHATEPIVEASTHRVAPTPPPAPDDSPMAAPDTSAAWQSTAATYGNTRPHRVEGTVERIDSLPDESPDPDIARILMSLIIVVDLVVLLGSAFLVVLIGAIIVLVIASLLGAGWLITVFSFLFQSVFYFLSPLFQALIGGRTRQATVPVNNYLVVDAVGRQATVRVKGRLRGVSLGRGDRIRVRGRWRHGVLHLQSGEKTTSGEPLLPERSHGWVWLVLVIAANVAGYVLLANRLPLRWLRGG